MQGRKSEGEMQISNDSWQSMLQHDIELDMWRTAEADIRDHQEDARVLYMS